MKILQIGMPKSGNFWLYKIIQNILLKTNIEIKSYIKQTRHYKEISNLTLSTNEQNKKDVIDIDNDGIYYRVSSIIKQPIIDIDAYMENITHVWSHSYISPFTNDIIRKFDKVIYIVRDPRDSLISMSNFIMTDYMKKYYPHNYISPQEYIDAKHLIHSKQWFEHVTGYLSKNIPHMHVIFYENLLMDFDNELIKLIDFLSLEITKQDYTVIKRETSAHEMNKYNPNHVNHPELYKWKKKLSLEQNSTMTFSLSDILRKLNYNISVDEQDKLPKLDASLKNMSKMINMQKLFWSALSTENKNYSFSLSYNNFFDQINALIESNKKFIIYGSGKIGKTIFKLLEDQAVAFVDKKSTLKYKKTIQQGATYRLDSLQNIEYDKIIITVLGREKKIINYIVRELNINPENIIIIKI